LSPKPSFVVYSGSDYTQPDPGYPQVAGPDFWGVPPEYRGAEPFPVAVLFDRGNTLFLGATQYVSHNATSGAWSYPRPLARLWPGVPLGTAAAPLRSAFTGADGSMYFFSRDEFTRSTDGVFSVPEPIPARWGNLRNTIASAGREKAVDAAFVWGGETTYLFSGDQYVRYSGPGYRHVDVGYPKSVVDDYKAAEKKIKDKEKLLAEFEETESRQLSETLALQAAKYRLSYAAVARELESLFHLFAR